MRNSADPDLQKPTDLDLHCLLKQGMSCSAREGLNIYSLERGLLFEYELEFYSPVNTVKAMSSRSVNLLSTHTISWAGC